MTKRRTNRFLVTAMVGSMLLLTASLWAQEARGVVNINTAGEEELSLLPRIGPATAKRIVEFREANGRFKAAEDLLLVRGIGESTFALIEPYIALEGETTLHEPVRVSRSGSES